MATGVQLGGWCDAGLPGAGFYWGSPVLGSQEKSSAPSPLWRISLSGHCAAWGSERGDRGNVKLSFLPSSNNLLLFLCYIQLLSSPTWSS